MLLLVCLLLSRLVKNILVGQLVGFELLGQCWSTHCQLAEFMREICEEMLTLLSCSCVLACRLRIRRARVKMVVSAAVM